MKGVILMKNKLSLSIIIALIIVATTCSYAFCEYKEESTEQVIERSKSAINIVNEQKREAKEAILKKVNDEVKSIDKAAQKAAQKAAEKSTTLRYWYQATSLIGHEQSYGGNGLGYSDSSWDESDDKNYNVSSAGIWGAKWGLGSGYVLFFPPSDGTYSIKTNYYLKGVIEGGNLTTTLKVVDSNTGGVVFEDSLNSLGTGSYNNNLYSPTKQVYLESTDDNGYAKCYTIIFEAQTEAGATASGALSNFKGTGTDKYIHWNSFGFQK